MSENFKYVLKHKFSIINLKHKASKAAKLCFKSHNLLRDLKSTLYGRNWIRTSDPIDVNDVL